MEGGGEGFISRGFRGFEDVGRENRLDAQQRFQPEAARENYFASGDVTRFEDTKMGRAAAALEKAAQMQLQAAQAQERTASRRNLNAQRE
jgi:hypothetical protein